MASSLPLEVQEKIFSNLHSKSLVKSCRRVCRTWRDVVDSRVLKRRALITPELRPLYRNANCKVHYQLEYFKENFDRNLLQNIHFIGWENPLGRNRSLYSPYTMCDSKCFQCQILFAKKAIQ
jgi:F-box-like